MLFELHLKSDFPVRNRRGPVRPTGSKIEWRCHIQLCQYNHVQNEVHEDRETSQMIYLVHRAHVDDAVPLRRHPQYLIQDLFHVQLLTLSIIKAVHYGGTFYSQFLQYSTSGSCREDKHKETVCD